MRPYNVLHLSRALFKTLQFAFSRVGETSTADLQFPRQTAIYDVKKEKIALKATTLAFAKVGKKKKFAYGVLEVSKASRERERDSENVGNGFTSHAKPSLILRQRYNHVRR